MMQRYPLTLRNFLLSFILGLAVGHAAAQEAHGSVAQAVTQVVRSQLNAFAEDDAETAFKLSTASTRQLIGTPDGLLSVIKHKFTPIYRHRKAMFSEPEIINRSALQIVHLTDADNLVWIAIYQVEQEADGIWRVDGCQLFETRSMSI
ncbi:DUF4864 domain-containing protein [Oxalobacteraceae bacterium R-40]|uniref:DUF4864 domain-containing protein n=1 Tax=Keguizhuia sedimenti TaxID=3064264 RepID=A0ABU1BRN0_9BURK|nr:DUF4864 domain-containing protein [Oxalobacteraceae bacterium R-40]